jgi:hypothetical protein
MKYSLFASALTALFATACFSASPARREFDRLTTAAEPEAALCKKYSADRRAALTAGTNTGVKYASREEALRVLSLIEARPTAFPRSAEASAYLLSHAEELLGSWNPFGNLANSANSSKITYDCEIFLAMGGFPKLLKERKALRFTALDEERLRAAIKQYLFETLPDGRVGIIGFAAQAYVLKSYLELGYHGPHREELLARTTQLMSNFEEDRKRILGPVRSQWREYYDMFTGERWLKELRWRLDFGRRYESLLRDTYEAAKPTAVPKG